MHTIYHGLDTGYFSPAPQPAADGVPEILSVGRFVEKKGFDQLVEACALLHARGLRFRCTIVGERGDALEPVKALIAQRGLQDVVQPARRDAAGPPARGLPRRPGSSPCLAR